MLRAICICLPACLSVCLSVSRVTERVKRTWYGMVVDEFSTVTLEMHRANGRMGWGFSISFRGRAVAAAP